VNRSAVVLLLLLCATGCGPDVPHVDGALHPSVRTVLDEARLAVRAAPASAVAWGRYAMLLDAHGYRAAAHRCYRRAAALDPDDVAWWHLQAVGLEVERPAEAERLYRLAIDAGPDAVEPRLRLATLLVSRGDVAATLDVLSAKPTDRLDAARWSLTLARCHEQRGAYDKACVAATEAARLAPDHRGIRDVQARLLYRSGDTGAAEAALAAARRLPPAAVGWPDRYLEAVQRLRADPHRVVDAMLEAPGTAETIGDLLARLTAEYPDDWTFAVDLARWQLEAGDPVAAVDTASRGLDRHPRCVELRTIRGAAHIIRGAWSAAVHDFEAALARRPGDAAAWSDLAFARQQLGLPTAIDALRRAIALSPPAIEDRVRLTRMLLDRRDFAGARESVAELALLAPEHPVVSELRRDADGSRDGTTGPGSDSREAD
jgi:tetratricopeptide (TPR) repeat protein